MKTGKNGKYFQAERMLDALIERGPLTMSELQDEKALYAPWFANFLKVKKSTARRYLTEYVRRHGTIRTKLVALARKAALLIRFI
jgi:outer membrane protein assembly factor BamD (BamD/ComL family)